MQIDIKIDSSQTYSGLAKILDAMKDTRSIRMAMGELLLESTRQRIRNEGPAPDGEPWQPLSPAYLLTKKGKGMLRESNSLIETLCWQLTDDGVAIGSNKPYAAIHQLGGVIKKEASTKNIRLRKVGNQTLSTLYSNKQE
jgi:phage virion morphogenesis protein